MKVLHIGFNVNGGAGLGMYRLHRDLLARGIDSRILCARRDTDDPTVFELPEDIKTLGARRNAFAALLNKFRIRTNSYFAANRMVSVLKGKYGKTVSSPYSLYPVEECELVREADVVHLHWVSNFVNLPSFMATVGKPVVWTIRDENPLLGFWHFASDMPKKLPMKEKWAEKGLRSAKIRAIQSCRTLAFASLSTGMDKKLAKHPIAKGRLRMVVPNSIDGTRFHPADRSVVRREYGIADDVKLLFFVSQTLNDPRKGLSELLEAVSSMGRTDLAVLCVGSGKLPPLPKNVRVMFEGRVMDTERLSALFCAADLFVTPSHAETFGKTTTEALACGTPVVSYPNVGALDIVGPDDGVLAKDFTAEAFRDAIDEALSRRFDPDALRSRVLERFSPNRVADAYVDLYGRLLSGASRGPGTSSRENLE